MDKLDIDQLIYWLTSSTDKVFEDFEDFAVHPDDFTKRHIFMDLGAPVLFVAHLDTVQDLRTPEDLCIRPNSKRIFASGLDDRLGVFMIQMLNKMGVVGDVLLTDHEEIQRSTAKFFQIDKQYNWVCEFDRNGVDFVTYGQDNEEFLELIEEAGLEQGDGSFSDISRLGLDNHPCMFNIGIGYHEGHSESSYFDTEVFFKRMELFEEFYKRHRNTYFESDRMQGEFDRTEEFINELNELNEFNEFNEVTR